MEYSVENPDVVAKTTLHALGDMIAACSPENQPSSEVLAHFLALYRELKGTPEGTAKTLQDILDALKKLERGLAPLSQAAMVRQQAGVGGSWTKGA